MEQSSKADVITDVCLQSRYAIGAKNEPDLQRAEAATERNLPVSVVGDEAGIREFVAQVGWGDGEGIGEVAAAFDVQAAVGSVG